MRYINRRFTYLLTGRSVRPVGRSVHTLRQSDRQSDEIKHPTVCPTGRTKRLHDTIVGPTSRIDQSDRPVGPTIGTCKRPVIECRIFTSLLPFHCEYACPNVRMSAFHILYACSHSLLQSCKIWNNVLPGKEHFLDVESDLAQPRGRGSRGDDFTRFSVHVHALR